MVCLHGFTDTWRTWELLLPALERRHDVLAPTLAGYAGGPVFDDAVGHAGIVDAIERAMPREREGQAAPYASRHERGISQLEGYLRDGERTGELRTFSTRVMAVAIRAAIDAVAYHLSTDTNLDLGAYARELAGLFDRATRSAIPHEPRTPRRPHEHHRSATTPLTGLPVPGGSRPRPSTSASWA